MFGVRERCGGLLFIHRLFDPKPQNTRGKTEATLGMFPCPSPAAQFTMMIANTQATTPSHSRSPASVPRVAAKVRFALTMLWPLAPLQSKVLRQAASSGALAVHLACCGNGRSTIGSETTHVGSEPVNHLACARYARGWLINRYGVISALVSPQL